MLKIPPSMSGVGDFPCLQFLLIFFTSPGFASECGVSPARRIDCYPDAAVLTSLECSRRGCCYGPFTDGKKESVPWCFFPADYVYSYILTDFQEALFGYKGQLSIAKSPSPFPQNALSTLELNIFLETPDRLHFKITDPSKARFEVPIDVPVAEKRTLLATKYKIKVPPASKNFSLIITRSDTNAVLFDTTVGPILYGDQFLQISTSLASSNIYALGERHGNLQASVHWYRIPFWAADHPPGIPENGNLYGDHPFYLVVEPDGNSHGVFFLNSNAKSADLQPEPALTWRSTGGILDFYIFLGPTPDQVIQQYTDTVGKPFMPPIWALGYHLCRWGYGTANKTRSYVEEMRAAKIPQDVQWNDIDYMNKKMDFTYNKAEFDTLPDLVKDLHSHGQHYVMIIDPGISNEQPAGSYPPYDDAVKLGVLVSDANSGNPIVGEVWPGKVVFPDFSHPTTKDYWLKQLSAFHAAVPFDGAWIDMNELSNFQDGSPKNCYKNSTYDYPPYVPRVTGGTLFARTTCPSSKQYNSTSYNMHSLTGLMEMKVTSEALVKLRNKRPFVISRSTFPSAGVYGGHWTGDILSTWEYMRLTIPAILGFNMFGIPLVGADICGFAGSTTEELCIRWSQLGAFYPFSRNHNDIAGSPQAPVDFSESAQNIIRNALNMRYSLLPYLYTLFHESHINGSTVARPLFFEFPTDQATYVNEEQFMWGPSLLVSPVLHLGANKVKSYFPVGVWYDIYMDKGKKIVSEGGVVELSAPLEYIPVHIRGGHIIPGSFAGTVTSMHSNFFLMAAADELGNASGTMFWDDGDSLDTYNRGVFAEFKFSLVGSSLSCRLAEGSPTVLSNMVLEKVIVLGVKCLPSEIKINGKDVTFNTDSYGNMIIDANTKMDGDINISWSCKKY